MLVLYDGTPQHRDNMVKLTKEKFYDSLLWHRVIPEFVIQGGDPDSKRRRGGQVAGRGRCGLARAGRDQAGVFPQARRARHGPRQQPEKASSGCQFYIVGAKAIRCRDRQGREARGHNIPAQRAVYKTLGGTPHLDGGYTVFGEVMAGMEVVDKISLLPRDKADRPNKDVRLLKVRKVRKKFLGIF